MLVDFRNREGEGKRQAPASGLPCPVGQGCQGTNLDWEMLERVFIFNTNLHL